MIATTEILTQVLEEMMPLHKFLGVKVLELREGYCKMLFPFREEVIGNFLTRRWHGGMIATAMDAVGGAAALTTLTSPQDKAATIDMRVDYLRGTTASDLLVEGMLVRSGNRIISTKMSGWQENGEKLVAEARGMYSVYRMDEKARKES